MRWSRRARGAAAGLGAPTGPAPFVLSISTAFASGLKRAKSGTSVVRTGDVKRLNSTTKTSQPAPGPGMSQEGASRACLCLRALDMKIYLAENYIARLKPRSASVVCCRSTISGIFRDEWKWRNPNGLF